MGNLKFYTETNGTLTEVTLSGVDMGKGFMDEIGGSSPLKDYVTNSNDMRHGVQYCPTVPMQNERQLTLTFQIYGATQTTYETNRDAFYQYLYGGDVIISVPSRRTGTYYRLKYKNGVSYDESRDGRHSQFAAKFTEPDPTNRGTGAAQNGG